MTISPEYAAQVARTSTVTLSETWVALMVDGSVVQAFSGWPSAALTRYSTLTSLPFTLSVAEAVPAVQVWPS